jgi:hypothetical protein
VKSRGATACLRRSQELSFRCAGGQRRCRDRAVYAAGQAREQLLQTDGQTGLEGAAVVAKLITGFDMGIDRYFAEYLIEARALGANFDRTATLGRLNLFIDQRALAQLLQRHGLPASTDDVRAIRTKAAGYSEPFLEMLGAREITSIDASEYQDATVVHDLNRPIGDELKKKFSAVIDGGTLEHVFNFPMAIKNCMDMLEIGGHFFAHTMANNFMGHGFYQFSPELFCRVFSADNGFCLQQVIAYESQILPPRWYRAADPEDIGERVELINSNPTYLLIHAERVADVPIFARTPQQSDYSALWTKKHSEVAIGPSTTRKRLENWARRYNETFLKLLPGPIYDVALAALVRGFPRRGFKKRQFERLETLRRSALRPSDLEPPTAHSK